MTESRTVTNKWLWLVVFLIGWPLVVQFVTLVGSLFGDPADGAGIGILLSAALCCVVSWLVCRFAIGRGATKGIWVSIALGSIPYLLYSAFALLVAANNVGVDPLVILGVFLLAIGPAAVGYIVTRRIPPLLVIKATAATPSSGT